MTRIYQPILHHALIYIDNILLFSQTVQEHTMLLFQFVELTKKFGIMLSIPKSQIAKLNSFE